MDQHGETYDEQDTYEEHEPYEGQDAHFEGQENYQQGGEEDEEEEEEEDEEESPGENGDSRQLAEGLVQAQPQQEDHIQTGNGDNNGEDAAQTGVDNDNSEDKPEEKSWPGWPGDNAFRMLVPVHKVGAVIGHKGDIIKKMSEETKARIRVLSSPPGAQERVVLVSAKEEPDLPVSPAMEAFFRVHKRVVDGLDDEIEPSAPSTGSAVPTRLLVPGVQAATIIGKQGGTIKTIQEGSNAIVRVSENVPPVALYDDRVVEIQGDPAAMHKALELITSYLRKFLVDRTVIPLFESQMQQQQNVQREQQMPAQQPWGPPQNYPPPPYSGGGPGYGGGPQHYMPPPPAHDNYYPPPELPPRYEKPPSYAAPPAYAREQPPPPGALSTATQLPPHVVTQVTQHMQVPLSYVDAVIGADGANISYIRRASGATVTVQETRGVPGEMTVEMVGSSSQVQTAQQLIQNFMAEAAAPGAAAAAAAAPASAPVDAAYGSYPSYASSYAAGTPGAGAADPSGGAYGSNYSTNYGY